MQKGIVVDLDRADSLTRNVILSGVTLPGIWGIKCRNLIHKGGYDNLAPLAKKFNIFADLKIYEVQGSVETAVALYASYGDYAPKFLTVSGDLPEHVLTAAVRHRGPMKILATTVLSDWRKEFCNEKYRRTREESCYMNAAKARQAGADGLVLPAHLLGSFWMSRLRAQWPNGIMMATGTRTSGPTHEHVDTRDTHHAFQKGATHVVVGREVTESADPLKTMEMLGAFVPEPVA